ncbi:aldehyde dehydrogenase family protein [Pandoraea terrigena]|uniref:Aldehyde dehydrogenase n=1 Tax=Pandoraea terrigena TaxID=2508292 RepID=A0A5E4V0I6_9BURK|nr:aldehyde dehydrogenase family protein [Pandoraea terrigena]VVE05802.1 aldehyde dehydrogenase [Pandoraea terrigena]
MINFPDPSAFARGHFIETLRSFPEEADIDVLRPSDGVTLGHTSAGSAQTIDLAVQSAQRALRASGWSTCAPRERARVLRRWADLIDADPDLPMLEAIGSTRPISEVISSDVPFTAEAIRFFAELADKSGGEVACTQATTLGMTVREPLGVVGAITPWNFPLSMASWKCGPALAAGNAIVLKPSELTPFSTLRLAQLAVDAGVPPGIFSVVNGFGTEAGAALVSHPGIAKITFTGSTRTGKAILNLAAASIKPVTLELGGKSPQLVFARVPDIKRVIEMVSRGFTANGGQACVSGTRLICHRHLADELVEGVVRAVSQLEVGLTWDAGTRFSPIISAAQLRQIDAKVQASREAGAEILCGGSSFDGDIGSHFYRPTVVRRVDAGMPVVREEVFGPVLTVQTFEDEEEGLALADHPSYGLAAGVHTSDFGQALRAMRRIEAGTVWINRYGRSRDLIIPTGGFKGSGVGKDLGRQAFEAARREKSVLMDFEGRSADES